MDHFPIFNKKKKKKKKKNFFWSHSLAFQQYTKDTSDYWSTNTFRGHQHLFCTEILFFILARVKEKFLTYCDFHLQK